MSWGDIGSVVPYLIAGAALGTVYFALLYRSVHLHAAGTTALRVAPLHVARLGLAISTFWIIAQAGALPLLSALLGFLIARFAVQRLAGSR